MKFLDQAKIYVESGNGGAGCLSFRRERNIPRGGPDGGNGGRGGDVIVEVVDALNTLIDYRYRQHFRAKSGQHGQGKQRSGGVGAPAVLQVPAGTQILAEDNETLIADLSEVGQRLVLLEGGDGGYGNLHFKSSTNRAPRRADPGQPGNDMWIWLRLKLLADAGLVGLPNAGKSTFLSATTRAQPKIADYPFTTLHPQLGVVYVDGREFVLADIPGLIEGAHRGQGLGDRFLGHVERCSVLLHLIDGTQPDVDQAYRTIRHELQAYGAGLAEKPEIIGLNKCDAMTDAEIAERSAALAAVASAPVLTLSGVSGDGVETVLRTLLAEIDSRRAGETAAAAALTAETTERTWTP
ncbi:MAG: GTPase ObgE [Alphaproteobacteria bacterium]|nr:GTPase ObgE [Alphaproteobacteria bacterium]